MNVKDQLGRPITMARRPERIISLVPSQTELLVYLGLEEQLVGITKFCVHPDYIRKKVEVIGGTKQVHLDKIRALQPDLIIANKEENTLEMVEALSAIAPVWVSDVVTLEDQYDMIQKLGQLLEMKDRADLLNRDLQVGVLALQESFVNLPTERVVYLIWNKPYMAAGRDTFIHQIIELCGWENCVEEDRYPEVDLEFLKQADRVLLSTEPFPFKQEHVDELSEALGTSVVLVDGEFFSWYGSRMLNAFPYFLSLRT